MTRYPIPCVAAVVVDSRGRVWLRREVFCHGDRYRLPEQPLAGGDDWHTSVTKLVAEGFLETGPERFVGLYADPKFHLVGDKHYLVTAFRFDAIVIPADTEWFAPDALPESLPPGDRQILADAL